MRAVPTSIQNSLSSCSCPCKMKSHPGAQGQLRCPKGRPRAPCKDAVVTWWVGSGRHPRHVRSTYLEYVPTWLCTSSKRRRALFHAALPKPSAWMLLILSQTEQTGASEKRRCGNGTCGLPPRGMSIHFGEQQARRHQASPSHFHTRTHTYRRRCPSRFLGPCPPKLHVRGQGPSPPKLLASHLSDTVRIWSLGESTGRLLESEADRTTVLSWTDAALR